MKNMIKEKSSFNMISEKKRRENKKLIKVKKKISN